MITTYLLNITALVPVFYAKGLFMAGLACNRNRGAKK